MSLPKVTSASDHRLRSSFEAIRNELLAEDKYATCLEKPLAFWVRPNDRRLPMVFLGCKVGELLHRPYTDIASTPGVGQKKIQSLVKLLRRATRDTVTDDPVELDREEEPPLQSLDLDAFDSSRISESVWVQWRETVRRHNLGPEPLGRLAPSLQRLPSVIWHLSMGRYLDLSLEEIRQLKTHGEKRVAAVLEVFFVVFRLLDQVGDDEHLAIRLAPRFVPPLEKRVVDMMGRVEFCSTDEIRRQLASPLLEQVGKDAGPTVQHLVDSRLGVHVAPRSVRELAEETNVTRARVYQLLEECSNVMEVRWPEGRGLLSALAAKSAGLGAPVDSQVLLGALCDMFFPTKAS